ncbi:serine hydrolase [Phycisphaeraceae bacterium D3-23]
MPNLHPRHWLPLLLTASLLAGCAGGGPKAIEPTQSPALAGLDAVIQEGIDAGHYPGAVCVVGRVVGERHELLWAQPYGHTAYDPTDPGFQMVTLDTIYDMASVTKVVGTTTAALLAMQDGRVAVDAPVSAYIDGFDANGKDTVTIHHLMTHTSGLKAYESFSRVEAQREEGESQCDALVRHYAALPQAYETGTDYTYSCLNFQTLARVNENAEGRSQEALLRERLYGPLGMDDTTWRPTAAQLERTAPTHRDAAGRPVAGVVHDPLARYHGSDLHCPGNAGLYSSAPDLARWCQLVLMHGRWNGEQLLDADLLAQATRTQTDADVVGEKRGLGFDVYESAAYISDANNTPGHMLVGHTGYTGTMFLIDQDTGVYMVLLTNRTFPKDTAAADQTPSISDIRKRCWAIARDALLRPAAGE